MTLLQFAHVSDTHLIMPGQQRDYSDIDPEWSEYARQILALPYSALEAAERLVEEINRLPAQLDFVLHTGDVAGQLSASEDYHYIGKVLSAIRYPICYVPGNHDVGEAFQRVLLGRSGAYDHVFEQKGVQIVCLDSNGTQPPHSGWLDEAQLEWLESICAAQDERPLVVVLHHHPFPMGVRWMDEVGLLNGEAMHQILLKARQRLRGVFFGHVHYAMDLLHEGILYSSAASAWCQFAAWPGSASPALDMQAQPGFSLVSIGQDSTVVRRHHYRMSYE